MSRRPAEERFWSRVDKTETCWLWTGPCRTGSSTCFYGVLSVNGKDTYVHRYSYALAKGAIPDGLEIDHLCRNTACVNPDHLEAVPHRINALRGNGYYAQALRKGKSPYCPRGHLKAMYGGQVRCAVCFREQRRRSDYERYWRGKGVDVERPVA